MPAMTIETKKREQPISRPPRKLEGETKGRAMSLTPREIFEAYSAGRMAREQMLSAASTYPYSAEPATDGYDWATPPPEGPTWQEVMLARRQGLITHEDYDEILDRSTSEQHGV